MNNIIRRCEGIENMLRDLLPRFTSNKNKKNNKNFRSLYKKDLIVIHATATT